MAQAMYIVALIRGEWLKLRHRWLLWILPGIMAALAQFIFWLTSAFDDDGITRRAFLDNLAQGMDFSVGFVILIALILAAAVTGGEYGWGTLRPALSVGAGRWQLLTSKAGVVLLTAAVILIIMSVSVAVSGLIAEGILTVSGDELANPVSWLGLLAIYGRMVYSFLPFIALAMFFAVLAGSNGVGIALAMGYYFVDGVILSQIFAAFNWGDIVLALLLAPNVSAWQNAGGGGIANIGGVSVMAQGFMVITIYALVLGGAAFALFLRRDIAGARGG